MKLGAYEVDLVRVSSICCEPSPDVPLRGSVEAIPVLRKMIPEGDEREHFLALYVDVKHRVKHAQVVSVGCLTSSLVHPREVFRAAILAGAVGVILGHNHPSGDPEPSAEDLALTRRLASAGTLLGISVLDHIILGDKGRTVSLRERGAL